MTRHAVGKEDLVLEALLREAEAGPVELTRDGEPVGVVLSVADYERLRSGDNLSFWEATQRFREQNDLSELDIEGALADARNPSRGRPVKL